MRPILMHAKPSLAGYYKLTAHKLDGTSRVVADWFENLILDAGLNRLGTNFVGTYCQVGTGAAAPNNANTALASILAATNTVLTSTFGNNGSSPYFAYATRTFRFGIGAAAGNLAEVGIGWAASGSLFSRSLIKDIGGSPTTITILADEILDVQYELRLYPPETDVTGSFVIDAVTYDYVLRAASVTSTLWSQFGVAYLLANTGVTASSVSYSIFYSGAIGAITGSPAGTASTQSVYATPAAYGNNNIYRDFSMSASIDHANHAGGVGSVYIATTAGLYQMGFTPKLPKDNTRTLTSTIRLTWARRP